MVASDEFLPMLLGPDEMHYRVNKDPLIGRMRIVGVELKPPHEVVFLLRSDEFPEVPEGEPWPEIAPQIETIAFDEDEAD